MTRLGVLALSFLLLVPAGFAQEVQAPKPGARDLCPVCGMLVSKYPQWVATVVYKDGHARHFDGAKDMFKYLLDVKKYAPDRSPEEIAVIAVTEYYGLARIDGRKAWYVIGSDVLSPMGHELIPLETREDAEAFMKDHAGKRILTFGEVTAEMVQRLDSGRF